MSIRDTGCCVEDRLVDAAGYHEEERLDFPGAVFAIVALGTQLPGRRLIPRSVAEKNNDGLTAVMRDITKNNAFYIAATTLCAKQNPNNVNPASDNAVLPVWRNTLLTVLVPSPWDFTLP